MEFIGQNFGIIMTILFLISELLGQSERIRANSIFGLIRTFLKGESIKAKSELEKALSPNQDK